MVKNPPAMRETWVQSPGWEDPLEEDMAAPSSTLAWRIPMDRGAWRATVHGVAKSRTRLNGFTFTLGFPGKESACNAGDLSSIPGGRSPVGGHAIPFQYSCLENPHGQRRLAGYSPWGPKEADMTE